MPSKRVSLIDVGKLKKQIQGALESALETQFLPNVLIPEVEDLVRELFSRTISQWEGGAGALRIDSTVDSRSMEPNPPALQVKTTRTKRGASIDVYVKSYIWNLLDQGRPDRTTKRVEKFVGRAKPNRTIPGTLDVSGNRQYTETVYVPKDKIIEGFKSRGWTQLIAEGVESGLGTKYPNIEFSVTIKEQSLAG